MRWQSFKGGIEYCPSSGKVMYDKRSAITAANHRFEESHVKLRVYECPACRTWHLTKQLRWRKRP